MKKFALITSIIAFLCFNSYGQSNDTIEPFPVERIMTATFKEHKRMWPDLGYSLSNTNYKTRVLTYELKEKGVVSFVSFKENWDSVDEIRMVFTDPETYNRILEYYIENVTEEKTDGFSRFFVHPSFTALVGFSIREFESVGKVYVIALTVI